MRYRAICVCTLLACFQAKQAAHIGDLGRLAEAFARQSRFYVLVQVRAGCVPSTRQFLLNSGLLLYFQKVASAAATENNEDLFEYLKAMYETEPDSDKLFIGMYLITSCVFVFQFLQCLLVLHCHCRSR